MDKLQGMQLFTRVVESGSFTTAAEQMGMSRALASKVIRNLEDALGVRLLNRTTRRMALTDEGRDYFERCRRLLGEVDRGAAVVVGGAGDAQQEVF